MSPNTVNTRIAVLQEKQDEMTQAINEIKADIKEIKTMLNANYMTRDEHISYVASTERALALAAKETDGKLELARKAAFTKMIVSVVVTAIITALVVFFFTHKDKI